jgi:16S rRNA (guanine966-N2)-methyltransferase
MRIVAGRFRGRRLRGPVGPGLRPTSDRVRESLFAWLGALDGARVLDLFAGTGAVGLEALSRGAASVTFVEHAASSLALLHENLAGLGVGAEVSVRRGDAAAVVRRLGREGARFDLVFADPPYDSPEIERALCAVVEAGVLAAGATLVVEGSRRHPLPAVAGLRLLEERRYGDTVLRRLAGAPPGGSNEA